MKNKSDKQSLFMLLRAFCYTCLYVAAVFIWLVNTEAPANSRVAMQLILIVCSGCAGGTILIICVIEIHLLGSGVYKHLPNPDAKHYYNTELEALRSAHKEASYLGDFFPSTFKNTTLRQDYPHYLYLRDGKSGIRTGLYYYKQPNT